MKLTTFLLLALAIFTVSACGGGGGGGGGGGPGGGGGSGDPLFGDYSDRLAGGYRDIGLSIMDSGSSKSRGCGYLNRLTRDQVRQEIESTGGRVTSSTDTEFCAKDGDYEVCLRRFGDSFIVEETDGDIELFDAIMTNVEAGHFTELELIQIGSLNTSAQISAAQADGSIPEDGECNPNDVTVTATADSINGAWIGSALRSAGPGYEEIVASLACSNRVCESGEAIEGQLPFEQFDSLGAWEGRSASQISGAAISPDGKLLSLYVCPLPLDRPAILSECTFMSLRKN